MDHLSTRLFVLIRPLIFRKVLQNRRNWLRLVDSRAGHWLRFASCEMIVELSKILEGSRSLGDYRVAVPLQSVGRGPRLEIRYPSVSTTPIRSFGSGCILIDPEHGQVVLNPCDGAIESLF